MQQREGDPKVTSTDINVASADHSVTLTGVVRFYAEKYAVEKAAQAIQGLANNIVVKPPSVDSDSEIAGDVVHAIDRAASGRAVG